jgi:hypothetical protein
MHPIVEVVMGLPSVFVRPLSPEEGHSSSGSPGEPSTSRPVSQRARILLASATQHSAPQIARIVAAAATAWPFMRQVRLY